MGCVKTVFDGSESDPYAPPDRAGFVSSNKNAQHATMAKDVSHAPDRDAKQTFLNRLGDGVGLALLMGALVLLAMSLWSRKWACEVLWDKKESTEN